MTRLSVRPATGPNDTPGEGEAVWRLSSIPHSGGAKTFEGGGRNGTDLTVSGFRVLLTVETADGRRLSTTFRKGAGVPEIDDLLNAWQDAWQQTSAGGRPKADFSPEVEAYRQEVRKRIEDGQPTALDIVVPLTGWSPRTVRRHIQWAGFRRWPDFVADVRRVVAEAER